MGKGIPNVAISLDGQIVKLVPGKYCIQGYNHGIFVEKLEDSGVSGLAYSFCNFYGSLSSSYSVPGSKKLATLEVPDNCEYLEVSPTNERGIILRSTGSQKSFDLETYLEQPKENKTSRPDEVSKKISKRITIECFFETFTESSATPTSSFRKR